MTLPLLDNKNPLFGLTSIEMCRKLANSGTDLKPWELLSLDRAHFTEDQIKKAYTQLALNIHPDKNLQIAPIASPAFTFLGQAREYMAYGLKSVADKRKEFSSIANNPFYQKYGDSAFSAESQNSGGVESEFYFDEDWNPQRRRQEAPQKKSHGEMNFIELAAEAATEGTIPEAVITRLKQFILTDNSLIDLEVHPESLSKKIIHIAINQRAEEFIIWLLEQGANPFAHKGIRLGLGLYMLETDIMYPIIHKKLLNVMHYLLNRHGAPFFYIQEENSPPQPIWRYLEEAIEAGHSSAVEFLLYNTDYLKFINNHKFDRQWKECIDIKDCSAITSLLIKHNLLANLEEALYHAMNKNSLAAVKEILKHKPKYTIKKLFTAYISYVPKHHMHTECDKEPVESLELMLHLFGKRRPSALDLKFILNHAIRNCSCRPILLTLIPHLYRYLNQYQLPTREEVATKKLKKQLPKEEQQYELLSTCREIAQLANHELLEELLGISSAPMLDDEYRYCAPLIFIFSILLLQRAQVDRYKETLTLLINIGGPALSTAYQVSENTTDYKNYTSLHLACELNLQEHTLHLLDKMIEGKHSLNTIGIKNRERERNRSELPTKYHQTVLHLAITKKNPALAIKLIQAGADYTIKAIIEHSKTHTYCFFAEAIRIERIEKTTLQLAIEEKQTDVIRALQIRMLDDYLAKRKEEDHYLSHFTVFGYTLFSFGYFNKTAKIKAAESFKEALRQGKNDLNQLDKTHIGALSQGRLGEIAQLSNHIKNIENPNENTQRQYRFC